MKCIRCEEDSAGHGLHFSFNYNKAKVELFSDGFHCINCAKDYWLEKIEKLSHFITVKNGEVKVSWRNYQSLKQKTEGCRILLSLGILSFSAKGSWNVVTKDPIGRNPKLNVSYLYFKRKKDAIDFASCQISKCEVHHIDDVLEVKRR